MMNLQNPGKHYSLASILPRVSNAELRAESVQENLPPYAGYIEAEVPGGTMLLRQEEGEVLTTELVGGDKVQAIMVCVQRNQSDLLVPGLRRHSLLFGRLWNPTTHDLIQQLSGSNPGVH
jgi:hypothetical protein